MKVNINDMIKVKLKVDGVKIYAERGLKYGLPERLPQIDQDGYTQFQMWDFIQLFGEHMSLGIILPFDSDIIIGE